MLTVKDLREKIKDLPDDTVLSVYVGGPDSQNWLVSRIESYDALLILPKKTKRRHIDGNYTVKIDDIDLDDEYWTSKPRCKCLNIATF